MSRSKTSDSQGAAALWLGGLAAVLASSCCLGPLVLLSLGVPGAWIGNLTRLEPYRPIFLGVALLALIIAARYLWRPASRCEPGAVCAAPAAQLAYRALFVVVAVLVLIAFAFPYVAPWFY